MDFVCGLRTKGSGKSRNAGTTVNTQSVGNQLGEQENLKGFSLCTRLRIDSLFIFVRVFTTINKYIHLNCSDC